MARHPWSSCLGSRAGAHLGLARSAEEDARLQALEEEARQLNASVDVVEARLMRDQAALETWA